jgi:hypothetical protein
MTSTRKIRLAALVAIINGVIGLTLTSEPATAACKFTCSGWTEQCYYPMLAPNCPTNEQIRNYCYTWRRNCYYPDNKFEAKYACYGTTNNGTCAPNTKSILCYYTGSPQ